jgi:hypothetical protein
MFKLSDRVKQTSITQGTGIVSLYDTFNGFQSFANSIGEGNTTYYTIENGSNFEVGFGTYSNNTLSRDLILDSSNNKQKISLNGVSIVFCSYPAERSFFLNNNGYASGLTPHYSGIAFPDGSIQLKAAVVASGTNTQLAYWNNGAILSASGLTWSSNTLNINNSVGISGNLNVRGIVTASGSSISSSQISSCTFVDNVFYRTSAGCFFHAYVDNAYDNMVALYSTNESSPTWKLGLKSYSASFSGEPTAGYIQANNGSAGIYATDQNYALINFTNGFWVNHRNIDVFNVSKLTGSYIYNQTASAPAFTVQGAAAQSANLQEWETYTSSVVASVNPSGQVYCSSVKFSGDDSVQTRAYVESYKNVTSSTSILITDDVIFVDTTSGNITITMPTAVNNGGKKIVIKRKNGNNNLIISTISSQTIDGSLTVSIPYIYQALTLVSDNTNWYII